MVRPLQATLRYRRTACQIANSNPSFVQNRRQFLSNTAAIGSASLLPAGLALPQAASAQGASDTLVIAAPATPQGLDIEFDVSLGSIDTLGAIYEYRSILG